MKTCLSGGLGLPHLFILLSVIFGCDAEAPSFIDLDVSAPIRETAELETVPVSADALAADTLPVVVIKDNGLAPDDGGTLPPSLWTDAEGPSSAEQELTVAHLAGGYDAGELKSGSTVFSVDELMHESRYVMSAELNDAVESFRQITRKVVTEAFTQGNNGYEARDTFTQNQNTGVLDVLVVIDNSGSMAQEQTNLASKLAPLISEVANADWQIGVVTTDNGCLRGLVKKGQPNAASDFSAAVTAGIYGSGNEQGVRYAVEGLSSGCQQGGWLRANSTVAVLIVSDEDNCSFNGTGCGASAWSQPQYLLDHLAAIRVPGRNARVYGILWHPSESRTQCSTAAVQAQQYAQLISATGGTWGSICDADYSSTLAQISQDISVILQNQFALSHAPSAGTLRVFVNGQPMLSGYSLSGDVVTFAAPPAEQAVVEFQYRYDATPIRKEFSLSQKAALGEIMAQINGNSTHAFTYRAATRTVSFDYFPPEDADIKFTYKRDEAMKVDFSLAFEPLEISTVEIGGVPVSSSEYSMNAKVLSFVNPPMDGAVVRVSYRGLVDVNLDYPYTMGAEQLGLRVYDLDSQAPISATYSQGLIRIAPHEFKYNRRFAVKDIAADGLEHYLVQLPVEPLVESVLVTFEGGECRAPELVVDGLILDLEACGLGSSMNAGHVSYDYVDTLRSSYEFDASFFAEEHQMQIWRVWLDGQLTTNYDIKDNKLLIGETLSHDTRVEISVSLLQN